MIETESTFVRRAAPKIKSSLEWLILASGAAGSSVGWMFGVAVALPLVGAALVLAVPLLILVGTVEVVLEGARRGGES